MAMNTLSRAASIRGRPLLRSALGLCGVYSRVATICSAVGLCGVYSRAATISLSCGIVRRLFEGGHYFTQLTLRDCAAPIRGRPLFHSALGLCGAYSRAATISLSCGIVRRLFEGGHYFTQLWDCAASIRGRPLFRSAVGLCGAYSRAATISLSSGIVRRLFEGGG